MYVLSVLHGRVRCRHLMPPPEPQISPSIEVQKVSIREFCDQMAIDEKRFIGLQHMRESKMIWLLLEKPDECGS